MGLSETPYLKLIHLSTNCSRNDRVVREKREGTSLVYYGKRDVSTPSSPNPNPVSVVSPDQRVRTSFPVKFFVPIGYHKSVTVRV